MTPHLDKPAPIAPERPIKRVQFYGRNREPFLCRDGEILVSGPAGTGKTMTLLTKLFLAAEKYPGMRGLICRKIRESLNEAALVTWETKVLPTGHSALNGPSRRIRQSYKFGNGSEIIIGGLDKSQKLMSTEYDMIYVSEAIELTENDWENLTTRLRNGKMPYQQIIADTNPDRPTHWLRRRCDAGKTKLIESRHEDNPSVIDPKTGQPTAAGRVYLGKLDALTGPRKARLRFGRWVQSEGVVYEGYDPAVHVIPKVEIKTEWKRYLSIDFGYTNPFSCLWLAEDPDGRLYVYREIYRTQTLVQDHAREILKQSGAWNAREFRPDWTLKGAEPRPLRVISDHDAEDRATLEKYLGIKVTPADKAVSPGIQAVTARLKPAGDGKPRLFFLADSLCHRPDSNLVEAKKPTRLSEEFDGYIWNPSGKEEPVKVDDHACDALRYAVVAVDGRPIPFTAANVSVGEPIQGTTRRAPQGRIIVEADDEPDSLFERMQS